LVRYPIKYPHVISHNQLVTVLSHPRTTKAPVPDWGPSVRSPAECSGTSSRWHDVFWQAGAGRSETYCKQQHWGLWYVTWTSCIYIYYVLVNTIWRYWYNTIMENIWQVGWLTIKMQLRKQIKAKLNTRHASLLLPSPPIWHVSKTTCPNFWDASSQLQLQAKQKSNWPTFFFYIEKKPWTLRRPHGLHGLHWVKLSQAALSSWSYFDAVYEDGIASHLTPGPGGPSFHRKILDNSSEN